MLLGLAIFFSCLAAVFGTIALHECGHFVAGISAGIPPDQMKICLATFPQHVALRDGEAWIDPWDHQRYVSRSRALIKDKKGAIAYVSGGLVAQTIVFIAFVFTSKALGVGGLWLIPLTAALVAEPLLYLFADVVFSRLRQSPCGDFSGLWQISPWASVLVTSLVVATHLTVLVHIIKGA